MLNTLGSKICVPLNSELVIKWCSADVDPNHFELNLSSTLDMIHSNSPFLVDEWVNKLVPGEVIMFSGCDMNKIF